MNSTPFKRIKSGRVLLTAMLATPLFFSSQSIAQVDQSELELLRAQLLALTTRLEELESSNQTLTEAVEDTQSSASSSTASSSWADRIEVSGDLRTRYENMDNDVSAERRDRSRIRARLDITAEVNEDFDVSVGLASGGDNPISTNQTLGGGSTTKDLRLDYAYFRYQGIQDLTISGGKYKNVFFRAGSNSVLFDSDFRPEGLGFQYENDSLFLNAGTMFIESDDRGGSQDTATMWGVQLGTEIALEEGVLTIGGSYYDAGVAGSEPFYRALSYGNTLDGSGAYVNDYQELELFAEAKISLGDQPLRLHGNIVQNLDADDFDSGWSIGAKLGNVSGEGSWEVGYMYQDLEADAVFAPFTDSDFAGGGSDNQGHKFDFAYGIGQNAEVGVTYYLNEYGEANIGSELDYSRFHLFMILDY